MPTSTSSKSRKANQKSPVKGKRSHSAEAKHAEKTLSDLDTTADSDITSF